MRQLSALRNELNTKFCQIEELYAQCSNSAQETLVEYLDGMAQGRNPGTEDIQYYMKSIKVFVDEQDSA